MGEALMYALGSVFSFQSILFMVVAVILGIIFGAIPGLSATMAVALFLPITYGMKAELGLSILIALYIGATSGGLISAILLKIPGTPSSVSTCFDGHPMVDKGQGPKALGVGIVFSFIGTILSVAVLMLVAPRLARVAIKFGPHEYFAIAIFSLSLIAGLSKGSMLKGVFAGVLGIIFSTVGIAPIEGTVRFTFGNPELKSGFDTLTVMIGFFAITEILRTAENIKKSKREDGVSVSMGDIKGFGFSLKEFKEQVPNALMSALIGAGIGILPGIGAGTSNLVSYSVSKNNSKKSELYGTGIIDGIVASETANNANIGGSLIPLMTLGVPGDTVTAILLGGFMIHGVQPGPLLFQNNANLVYTIFVSMIFASVIMLVLEFYGMRIFAKLLNVPKHILLPIIVVLCVVGAFGLNSRIFDVWTILIFGILGYLFYRFKVPKTPFIMGFILGPMLETNFRRALMLSDNSFLSFFKQPISAIFLSIALVSLVVTFYRSIKSRKV